MQHWYPEVVRESSNLVLYPHEIILSDCIDQEHGSYQICPSIHELIQSQDVSLPAFVVVDKKDRDSLLIWWARLNAERDTFLHPVCLDSGGTPINKDTQEQAVGPFPCVPRHWIG